MNNSGQKKMEKSRKYLVYVNRKQIQNMKVWLRADKLKPYGQMPYMVCLVVTNCPIGELSDFQRLLMSNYGKRNRIG